MIDFLKSLGVKPIHLAGGSITIAAILHLIFWKRISDFLSGFWSAAGDWFFKNVKKFFPSSPKRFSSYQIGRLVQKVKDQQKEIKAVKKEIRSCNLDRKRCEALNAIQNKRILSLQDICDTLTKKMLAVEKKVMT